MNTYRLRVLHVSDIHAKCPTTSAQKLNDIDAISFVRAIDSFIEILSEIQANYPVDVVCITGDIAHSGQKEQYLVAQSLFARIAQTLFTNIEFTIASQNFFIVPGNHDIERNKEQALWKKARTVLQGNDRAVSQWLHKGWRPTGTRKDLHDILKRSENYTSWIKECYPHISKGFGTRGPIGYYYKLVTNKFPFPIHISGLDSSWLCGDDKDYLNIVLTTEQIDQLSYTQNTKHEDGFRLALLHHPLTCLRDHNECKTLLAKSSDLLLCGHLHFEECVSHCDPDQEIRVISAGAFFESPYQKSSAHIIDIYLNEEGSPIFYEVRFLGRKNDHWFLDPSIYHKAKNGILRWEIFQSRSTLYLPTDPAQFSVTKSFQNNLAISTKQEKDLEASVSDKHERHREELDIIRNYLNDGKLEWAIERCQKLEENSWEILSNHNKYRLKANLGYAFCQKGDYDNGVKYLKESLLYTDDKVQSQLISAQVAYLENEKQRADEMIKKVIEENPNNHLAWAVRIQSNEFKSFDEIERTVPSDVLNCPDFSYSISSRAFQFDEFSKAEKYILPKIESGQKSPEAVFVFALSVLKQEVKDGLFIPHTGFNQENIEKALNKLDEIKEQCRSSEHNMCNFYMIRDKLLFLLGKYRELDENIAAAFQDYSDQPSIRGQYVINLVENKKIEIAQQIAIALDVGKWDLRYASICLDLSLQCKNMMLLQKAYEVGLLLLDTKLEYSSELELFHFYLSMFRVGIAQNNIESESERLITIAKNSGLSDIVLICLESESLFALGQSKKGLSLLKKAFASIDSACPTWLRLHVARTLNREKCYSEAFSITKEFIRYDYIDELSSMCLESASKGRINSFLFEAFKKYRLNGVLDERVMLSEIHLYFEYSSYHKVIDIISFYLGDQRLHDDTRKLLVLQRSLVGVQLKQDELIEKDYTQLPSFRVIEEQYFPQLIRAVYYSSTPEKAQEIAYQYFRLHSGSYYAYLAMIQSVGLFEPTELKPKLYDTCEHDTAVRYINNTTKEESWHILESLSEPRMELNEFSLEHSISKALLGKRVGDTFCISSWYPQDDVTGEIIEIVCKYSYRFSKCLKDQAILFPDKPIMRHVTINFENIEQSDIFKIGVEIKKQNEKIIETYLDNNNIASTSVFAHAFQKTLFESALGLASDGSDMLPYRMSFCTEDELNTDLTKYDNIVMDSTSVASCIALGLYEYIKNESFPSPVIPELTAIDVKSYYLDHDREMGYTGTYVDDKGKYRLYFADSQSKEFDANSIISWLTNYFSQCGGEAISWVFPNLTKKEEFIYPKEQLIAMAYAKDRNIPLWTDDRTIAAMARNQWGIKTINTQGVLIQLESNKILEENQYFSIIETMMKRNYCTLFLYPQTFYKIIRYNEFDIHSKGVNACLDYLGNPELNDMYVAQIIVFLLEAIHRSSPTFLNSTFISLLFNDILNRENSSYISSKIESLLIERKKIEKDNLRELLGLIQAWHETRKFLLK